MSSPTGAAGDLRASTARPQSYDEDEDDLEEWEEDYAQAAELHSKSEEEKALFVSNGLGRWVAPRSTGTYTQTFLHLLASKTSRKRQHMQWFMARVIAAYPEMLGTVHGPNKDTELTPLTEAVQRGNIYFIRALMGVCKSDSSIHDKEVASTIWKCIVEAEGDDAFRQATCLHAAITWKPKPTQRDDHVNLLQAILCSTPELIRVKNSLGHTPLHLAMIEADERTALEIISRAPGPAFLLVDDNGCTPLHLAVEYGQCTDDRVAIVEMLLQKGPEAVKISEKDGNSAFQYHTASRRRAEDEEEGKLTKVRKRTGFELARKAGPTRDTIPSINKLPRILPPTSDPEPLPQRYQAREGPLRAMGLLDTQSNRSSNRINVRSMPGQYLEGVGPNFDFELVPRPKEQQEMQEHKGVNPHETSSPTTSHISAKRFNGAADKIAELLKLEYLRQLPPRMASQSLYISGRNSREIWFNFGRKRDTTEDEFLKLFDHLKFDSALQSVTFPRLTLTRSTKASADQQHQGRDDLVKLFKWLKGKGVKHIINVKVEDEEWPSHTDEAIEKALSPFKIEVLDWNKEDLCPVTIGKLGKTLREIDLQWSGKNSVLRAWSEKNEGLCRLSGLKKIIIHQNKGLESPERTKANLDKFEERLKSSTAWKKGEEPQVIRPEILRSETLAAQSHSHEGNASSRPAWPDPFDHHRWIERMETFTEEFKNLLDLDKHQTDTRLNPVTVALIDDGVDNTHGELEGVVKDGQTFADRKIDGRWIPSPYWESESQHGTLMARLIRRVCPSAHIYPIKVGTTLTDSNKPQIDPSSAAQAIHHAAECGAQIICTAWTIKPPSREDDRDSEVINEFKRAVERVKRNSVLMLCSASDEGQYGDNNYPHAVCPDYTFRVGAARWTGTSAEYVNTGDISFSLPGDDVPLKNMVYHEENFRPFDVHKGSSIATALAAGLMGLVYECVRMGIIYENDPKRSQGQSRLSVEDLRIIRQRQEMEDLLYRIGLNKDNKYLYVWETFRADDLKGAKEEKAMKVIDLARKFLRKY